ncbi:hypothetical protein ICN84_03110 [Akkermansia glycaniphila]|uniref:FxLYD domain-containing protein n=1 Tax=Akkermansia glycaniphila TaxID=1679444 RepID=UPI001C0349C9|nr:FxLYD domain-containing protein [Akkermansia glycaniphila]MBT9449059.1 hypothetical protein [Akkermansia glycaniphila]
MLPKITQLAMCFFASMCASASPFDQIGDMAVYSADKDGTKYSYTFLAVGKDDDGHIYGEGTLETEGTRLSFDYLHAGGEEYEIATRLKSLEADGSPKVAKRKATIRPGRNLVIQGMNAYFPTQFALKKESKPRDWKEVRERNYYFKQGAGESNRKKEVELAWVRGSKNLFEVDKFYVFECPEERFAGFENPVDLHLNFMALGSLSGGRMFGVGYLSVEENGQKVLSNNFLWKQVSDVSGVVQFHLKEVSPEADWQELMLARRDGVYQFSGWGSLKSTLPWKCFLIVDKEELGSFSSERDVEGVRRLIEPRVNKVEVPKKVVPHEDFSVVGKVSVQRRSGFVTVVARIQNNTNRDYRSVYVSYALLDAQGNPIGKTLGSISDLRAGQSKVVESRAEDQGAKHVELDSIEGFGD